MDALAAKNGRLVARPPRAAALRPRQSRSERPGGGRGEGRASPRVSPPNRTRLAHEPRTGFAGSDRSPRSCTGPPGRSPTSSLWSRRSGGRAAPPHVQRSRQSYEAEATLPSAEAASATANTPKNDDDARARRGSFRGRHTARRREGVRRRDSRGGLTGPRGPEARRGSRGRCPGPRPGSSTEPSAVLGPVVEKFLGGHGPDAGQLVELIERGGVEVDAAAYTSATDLLRAPERLPGSTERRPADRPRRAQPGSRARARPSASARPHA